NDVRQARRLRTWQQPGVIGGLSLVRRTRNQQRCVKQKVPEKAEAFRVGYRIEARLEALQAHHQRRAQQIKPAYTGSDHAEGDDQAPMQLAKYTRCGSFKGERDEQRADQRKSNQESTQCAEIRHEELRMLYQPLQHGKIDREKGFLQNGEFDVADDGEGQQQGDAGDRRGDWSAGQQENATYQEGGENDAAEDFGTAGAEGR